MEESTLRFLAECGLAVRRPNPRQYHASLAGGLPIQAVFQRAADIPHKLSLGLLHAGITGYDIYHEYRGESDGVVVAVDDLGFARCSLVLAVPDVWLDVSTFEDLADVATQFRRKGRTLRIATKFPRLVRRFLLENGLIDFSLVESSGALEIAPQMGYADLIADITETGTTLRANHLKPLAGGTVLDSQACLLVNRVALADHADLLATIRGLLEMIEGHRRAGEVLSLTANVEGCSMEDVAGRVLACRALAGVRGPTVTPVFDPDAPGRVFAVTIVVPADRLAQARDHLRRLGGGAITVTRPLYTFSEQSTLFTTLQGRLADHAPRTQEDTHG
jgi:ATP phosphoribosyltransferase